MSIIYQLDLIEKKYRSGEDIVNGVFERWFHYVDNDYLSRNRNSLSQIWIFFVEKVNSIFKSSIYFLKKNF
jgi:hypothetical protein